jgi:23S rRNA pseudouridine1911/1915/1917 synthase
MPGEDIIITVENEALLLQFLLQHLKQKSRDNVKSMLRYRQVWVDGRVVSQFNHPLRPGQQVTIKKDRQTDANLNRYFRFVFEDEYIVVIDKQAGLLSISAGSEHLTAYSLLSYYLKQKDPAGKIFVVHRLDRDTSGVMMFAKSEHVQTLLQKAWQTGIRERTYMALVEGKVEKPAGTIRSYLTESKAFVVHSSKDPDKGELAITHFRTLKSNPDYSLLEVSLETGKKNQIRVHMQDIGHSIVGDKKYGANGNPIGRLGLHASVLAFTHPVSGEQLRFTSDIPARFLRVF